MHGGVTFSPRTSGVVPLSEGCRQWRHTIWRESDAFAGLSGRHQADAVWAKERPSHYP